MGAPLSDWLPPAVIGAMFTGLGVAKFYGLRRGIVGGRGAPLARRLCGT